MEQLINEILSHNQGSKPTIVRSGENFSALFPTIDGIAIAIGSKKSQEKQTVLQENRTKLAAIPGFIAAFAANLEPMLQKYAYLKDALMSNEILVAEMGLSSQVWIPMAKALILHPEVKTCKEINNMVEKFYSAGQDLFDKHQDHPYSLLIQAADKPADMTKGPLKLYVPSPEPKFSATSTTTPAETESPASVESDKKVQCCTGKKHAKDVLQGCNRHFVDAVADVLGMMGFMNAPLMLDAFAPFCFEGLSVKEKMQVVAKLMLDGKISDCKDPATMKLLEGISKVNGREFSNKFSYYPYLTSSFVRINERDFVLKVVERLWLSDPGYAVGQFQKDFPDFPSQENVAEYMLANCLGANFGSSFIQSVLRAKYLLPFFPYDEVDEAFAAIKNGPFAN